MLAIRSAGLLVVLAVVLQTSAAAPAQAGAARLWGLKSCGSSPPLCGTVASAVPVHLFSLHADGSGLVDHGRLRSASGDVVADALAISPLGHLFAFVLAPGPTSTLVSVDAGSATVTPVGPSLPREVRGAAFDRSGVLWALDDTRDELLRVDPATGLELPGARPVTVGGAQHDLTTGCDLAFDQGAAILTSADAILALDVTTGTAVPLRRDSGQFLCGVAFVAGATRGHLFTFEVNGTDDVYAYDLLTTGVPRSDVLLDLLSFFNAGRGDLAALDAPVVRASCTSRNGSGVNPIDYVCAAPPVVGANWDSSIAIHSATIGTALALGLAGPDPGTPSPFGPGELLISFAVAPVILPGGGTYALPVPADPALIGVALATQGFRVDGPALQIVALNAVDVVLGR